MSECMERKPKAFLETSTLRSELFLLSASASNLVVVVVVVNIVFGLAVENKDTFVSNELVEIE